MIQDRRCRLHRASGKRGKAVESDSGFRTCFLRKVGFTRSHQIPMLAGLHMHFFCTIIKRKVTAELFLSAIRFT